MPYPPLDAFEERQVRNLTHSVHAPANGTVRTKPIVRNWDGLWARETAAELGCLPRLLVYGCMHVTSVGSTGWA